MAFTDIITRVNTACAAACGETVTHVDAEDTETTCYCVLTRQSEPVLSGGQITINEDHYRGQIPQTSVAIIVRNDTLVTADGTEYRIDETPSIDDGMWQLVLRRLPA